MPDPWQLPDFDGHEGVHHFFDPQSGFQAIIAIHSTFLGPAGGGVRFWHYADTRAALTDALRLSRGMSFKNAMAGLAMGGGKGVILADPTLTKTPDLINRFADWVVSLGGRYVTAQDVGMSLDDMINIGARTPYVSGLPPKAGRAGGDPGPSTALGVFLGIQAAVRHKLGRDDMNGVHVAIQGVGSVGGGLARHLAKAGAQLTLADVNTNRALALAQELGAAHVPVDDIMAVKADVFSPCALGAILTEASIAALNVKIVAGGANNQLAGPEDGMRLAKRGILYAPDYVINAGGIINVATGYFDVEGVEGVDRRINQIPDRLIEIWQDAEREGLDPARIADGKARALIGR